MALQLEYTDERVGLTYPEAYGKVLRVRIHTGDISGNVVIWPSKLAHDNGVRPLSKVRITLPYTDKIKGTKNYLKRIYEEALANHSEFLSAKSI